MTDDGYMMTRTHPDPRYHTRMPMKNRAAQFAPFAALTGYEEAVEEAHRLTDHRPCGRPWKRKRGLSRSLGLSRTPGRKAAVS